MTSNEPEDAGVTSDPGGSSAAHSKNNDGANSVLVSPKDGALQALLAIICENHHDLTRLNAAMQALIQAKTGLLPLLAPKLKDSDAEVRTYVALILGELDDLEAVNYLIEALDDASINVKAQAIESIGKLRSIAAVAPLLELVSSAEFELAFPAIEALAAIGAERAAYAITPLLDHPLLGSAAIRALGRLGTEDAVQPLVECLKTCQAPALSVIRALSQIEERLVGRFGQADYFSKHLQLAIDSVTLQKILDALNSVSDVDRPSFIRVLNNVPGGVVDEALASQFRFAKSRELAVKAIARRGPSIIPRLVAMFPEEARDTQLAIVKILSGLSPLEALEFLYQLLDFDDEEVVACALQSLASRADARLYDTASRFLDHPNDKVRLAAVAAINASGDSRLETDLPSLFDTTSVLLQDSAARIAGYFGFSNCTDPILSLCRSDDERLRKTAIETLPCFDDPRVIQALAAAIYSAHPSTRIAAVRAATEVENPAVVPLLLESLRDPDVWVRYNSAHALAHFPSAHEVVGFLLVTAEDDPAVQVRVAAIRSLGAFQSEAVKPLATWVEDSNPDLAAAAIEVLGSIGGSEVVPPLRRAANSPNPDTRGRAITALGASKAVEAVEPLYESARGDDATLSDLAIAALSQIPAPEAAKTLLDLARSPSKRANIVLGLVRLSSSALSTLAQGLQDSNRDVRYLVVEVLSRLASREAGRLLNIALQDPDRIIRDAALFCTLAAVSRWRAYPERIGVRADVATGGVY